VRAAVRSTNRSGIIRCALNINGDGIIIDYHRVAGGVNIETWSRWRRNRKHREKTTAGVNIVPVSGHRRGSAVRAIISSVCARIYRVRRELRVIDMDHHGARVCGCYG